MPTPPAWATAVDLSTRAVRPRSHTTTAPCTAAASRLPASQIAAASGEAPAAGTSRASTMRVSGNDRLEVIAPA